MNNNEEPTKEFNLIQSISEFCKNFISKLKDIDGSNLNNAIVQLGRTDEEKEQLQDMCDEIDSYHRRIKELRESGMTPGKWLEREIETELEKVDPEVSSESKDEFKKFIFDQLGNNVEAQVEALDEELDLTIDVIKGEES